MKKNYGLLIAPNGDSEVIDTDYSHGIMDLFTEDGHGFVLIVAPVSFVDHYLNLQGLTGSEYQLARAQQTPNSKKEQAIEAFWGTKTETYNPLLSLDQSLPREDTGNWEVRMGYENQTV